MVNELLSLSPKRQEENEEDFYRIGEKTLASESSDEDTTSSSLLPIPDTLDEMRNQLKTTIGRLDGACVTTPPTSCNPAPFFDDFAATPKPTDFHLGELNGRCPTEREASIAKKITSANQLLDDLLSSSNILSTQVGKEKPLVFTAATVRHRGKPAPSEVSVSDPSTESTSSSSGECCHGVTVTPFIFPSPACEHSRCPCERKETPEQHTVVTEQPPKVVSAGVHELKPKKRRHFLPERMWSLRRKWSRRKKGRPVDQEQQTHGESAPVGNGLPQTSGTYLQQPSSTGMNFLASQHSIGHWNGHNRRASKCTCPDDPPSTPPTPEPECTCPRIVRTPIREDRRPVRKQSLQERDKEGMGTQEKEVQRERPEPAEAPDDLEQPSEESVGLQKDGKEDTTQIPQAPPPPPPPKVPMTPIPVRATKGRERIDIYYFDHGNSAYYRTTDNHPAKFTEYIIERTDEYATKFWAEIFGTVTIAIAFVISFILQLYRCLFTAIIRSLLVGLIQIFSDYFIKPLLTVFFNGLIQPFLILGYNIATSLRDFCIPVCEICEFCAKDLAIIFRSCRVVEVNQRTCSSPSCNCRHV